MRIFIVLASLTLAALVGQSQADCRDSLAGSVTDVPVGQLARGLGEKCESHRGKSLVELFDQSIDIFSLIPKDTKPKEIIQMGRQCSDFMQEVLLRLKHGPCSEDFSAQERVEDVHQLVVVLELYREALGSQVLDQATACSLLFGAPDPFDPDYQITEEDLRDD